MSEYFLLQMTNFSNEENTYVRWERVLQVVLRNSVGHWPETSTSTFWQDSKAWQHNKQWNYTGVDHIYLEET